MKMKRFLGIITALILLLTAVFSAYAAENVSVIPTPTYASVETTNTQYTGYFNADSDVKTKLIARYNAGAYSNA